jgi:HSP20 family molecular chaperone IbpA
MKEEFGRSSFPFNKKVQFPILNPKMTSVDLDIHEYIQNTFKRSLEQNAMSGSISSPKTEVIETHRSIIVRVDLLKDTDPELIRVLHSSHILRIENLGNGMDELRIKLPELVYLQRGRSRIENGILEVRLLKRNSGEREREIFTEY